MRILGLMSGTSIDAIDQAVVEFDHPDVHGILPARVVWHGETPWPAEERRELLALLPPASTDVGTLDRVNAIVGSRLARVAQAAIEVAGPVDLVVSHGQTLHHWVEDGRTRASLQVGNPAWIAEATGLPVLHDLRAADIAAGGHGAPLVPLLDQLMFAECPSAVVNLGGIANVSIVGVAHPVAGDTGPANCLLDAWAHRVTGAPCDIDARLAGAGRIDKNLLSRMLQHPWLALPLPKSTGREVFHLDWLVDLLHPASRAADVAATLIEFSARTLCNATRDHRVERTIVSGGGVHNPLLMRRLRELLPHVQTCDSLGLPGDAKEAIWCALVGWMSRHNLPGVATDADGQPLTSARAACILGSLAPSPVAGWPPPCAAPPPRRMRLTTDPITLETA